MADLQSTRFRQSRAASPTGQRPNEPDESGPGIALCLSGGGYRAMLFHVGSLWRLNEAGYLGKLDQISSVSGGSITAAYLGLKWNRLAFQDDVSTAFVQEVVVPIRQLASRTIDIWPAIRGLFGGASDTLAAKYRDHLYGAATLQDLPDRPRFAINATSLQSGALWRFMKAYMSDWRVGQVQRPNIQLAAAVAASSAFPPFLGPFLLRLRDGECQDMPGTDLHRPPYTTRILLTDGGVFDNLGLATAWYRYKTILVSDGGGRMEPAMRPKSDWPRQAMRVLDVIDNQVRAMRKRQVIESYVNHERSGAYWGIRGSIEDYGLRNTLPCPYEATLGLSEIPTRLARLEDQVQERLINWGYASCDAALRAHVDGGLPPPVLFPYRCGV